MNKTAIKNFAVWARRKLISDITYKAGMIGITENGIADPLPQSTGDLQFFDIGTKNYAEVSGIEIKQRNALVNAIKAKERSSNYKTAFQNVLEEVAYTWFNRLIAVRFMEVNDYLPSRVRVLSSENPAKNEPDFVTNPFDTDLEFTPYEQDRVLQLKDENKLDELFRMLFIKQCNKFNEILPELFEKTDDYSELLLAISFTDKDGVVYHLIHDISESDFNISQEGQIEIIGWLYQYYNLEEFNEIYDGDMSKRKIKKEDIPAATQLFTPDWVVRYMIENSLGRLWVDGHPNEQLKSGWKYFLDEPQQDITVLEQTRLIKKEYESIAPEEIRVVDPCMGSGHILVYAFDVLMQIYESYGYTQRDAARSILENNLYGFDIDERAYQLAYFAVMMKARQYNRRILEQGIYPHLYSLEDSRNISQELIDFVANGNKEISKDLSSICDDLRDAKECGSILNIHKVNFEEIYARVEKISSEFYGDIFKQGYQRETIEVLLPIVKQAEAMTVKFHVACTNPPYLSNSRFSENLNAYVLDNYPEEKADMAMVMLKKMLFGMVRKNGFVAAITTVSWMFLKSFERFRENVITNKDFVCLCDFGTELFEGKIGHLPVAAWVNRNSKTNQRMISVRLVDYCYSRRDEKEQEFFNKDNWHYTTPDLLHQIPGSPLAYWVNENFANNYQKKKIEDYAEVITGMTIGDNNKYLRLWFEVSRKKIAIGNDNMNQIDISKTNWIPYSKGGNRRNWYGNYEYVVNWSQKANFNRSKTTLQHLYLREALTWPFIAMNKFSARLLPCGFLWDVAGSPCFFREKDEEYYALGLMCSKVTNYILNAVNPTVNVQAADIAKIPMIVEQSEVKQRIIELVNRCLDISKKDWDSFETSWDFVKHPLVPTQSEWDEQLGSQFAESRKRAFSLISWHYNRWEDECNNRFDSLKNYEEELNKLFIDIYGFQDKLTPEVDEKDVTVRKADLQRDIKSLLSYAVGCMLGRYSIDFGGLSYAGGVWDKEKYVRFTPDKDNFIPITDEEYFDDDIIGLLCKWLEVVYGKESLEENLDYIAQALGNKGNTSRDVIRNYFLTDFYKDHSTTYSVTGSGRRPVYWLFDSGKQNGFKGLVYMHRWNSDTVGNLRVEYLHRMQRVYEKEIERMQDTIDHTQGREQAAAQKRKEKLVKQLKEAKDYDAKIAHIALARVDIDLDDGVKVNYEKVQKGQDGKNLGILAKI